MSISVRSAACARRERDASALRRRRRAGPSGGGERGVLYTEVPVTIMSADLELGAWTGDVDGVRLCVIL